MAEYMIFPSDALVHKVSHDLPAAHAAFAEPLSSALHAVERAAISFEDVVVVAGLRCMGGQLLARLAPTDAAERQKAIDAGHDPDRILTTEDLVAGENVFFTATGVTDGDLLRGVRYTGSGAHTQSIVMRSKSGTVRIIDAYHRLDKLREYASSDYASATQGPAGLTPPSASAPADRRQLGATAVRADVVGGFGDHAARRLTRSGDSLRRASRTDFSAAALWPPG